MIKRLLFFIVMLLGAHLAGASVPVTEGLIVHLDAAALEGTGEGQRISFWPDSSSAGHNAWQSLSSLQPVYRANALNNMPALEFDGMNDWLDLEDELFDVAQVTIFAVARYRSIANQYILSGQDNAVPDSRVRIALENGHFIVRCGSSWYAGQNPANTQPHIFTLTSETAGYLDGASTGYSENKQWQPVPALSLGSYQEGSHSFLNGCIAEVLIFNRILEPEHQNLIGAYLAKKYALNTAYQQHAHNPYPADDAVDVFQDSPLRWHAGCDVSPTGAYRVYLGTDYNSVHQRNPAAFVGTFNAARCAPGLLALGETDYYWCVDTHFADGSSHAGPVWHFTTSPPLLSAAVTVDPAQKYQIFEGFGQCSSRGRESAWYHQYPAWLREQFVDTLYTLKDKGLGLNISNMTMMPAGLDGFSHVKGQWDWDQDDLTWIDFGAAARGAIMKARWDRPPNWMRYIDGDGANRLRPGMEDDFAQHFAYVVKYLREHKGIKYEIVEPFCEPDGEWWVNGGAGCQYTPAQMVLLIQELRDALDDRGLSDVEIQAYEAGYIDRTTYLDALLSSPIEPQISTFSFHQYFRSDWGMAAWRQRADDYNKALWQTEWGDWYHLGTDPADQQTQAMNYANRIMEAFEIMRVSGWVMWEFAFLFDETNTAWNRRKAYWTVAQFSRHIRPGMQMIGSPESSDTCRTTAWLTPETDGTPGKLVLITVNSSAAPRSVDYDLSAFLYPEIESVIRTSAHEDYRDVPFTPPADNTFHLNIPGHSTVTITVNRPAGALEMQWTFDENSCLRACDSSGNDRHASLWHMNPATCRVPGKSGTALAFDGVNDYARASHPAIYGHHARTICGWLKTADGGNFLQWGVFSPAALWRCQIDSSGRLSVDIGGGHAVATRNIADGNWHHIAIVLNADDTAAVDDIAFYIDGAPDPVSTSFGGQIDTALDQTILIGTAENPQAPGMQGYYTGLLDELQIYSKALTSEQIQALYEKGYFCQRRPAYDFNNDCLVDIEDLLLFAADWLREGISPR